MATKGAAALRLIASGLVLVGASCSPSSTRTPQPPPAKPLVTRRPGLSATPVAAELMSGSLFPHPSDPGKLELDAPLTTELAPPSTAYFAFELHVVVDPGQWIELAWRDGAALTPIFPFDVEARPCEAPFSGQMAAASERWTGRPGPAAFSLDTEAFLEQGKALWFSACRGPDGQGDELPQPYLQDGKLHFDPVVLLPASLAHAPTNGHDHGLSVRAKNLYNSLESDPVFVAIERAPVMIAVVGDSIAWGQGLREQEKFYSLLTKRIGEQLSRPDSDLRLVVRARSGTILASATPPISIESAGGDCHLPLPDPRYSTGADYGEVPNDNPTIPCQLQDISRRICQVALPDGINAHTFSVDCHDGPPPSTAPLPDVATATPAGVTFSLGARYDFVFMDGCINDLSGVAIATAPKYLIPGPLFEVDPKLLDRANSWPPDVRAKGLAAMAVTRLAATGGILPGQDLVFNGARSDQLSKDIRDKCTVTNAIGDLRQVLPNASIAYFGYHVFWSTDSAASESLPRDCGVALCGLPGPQFGIDPLLCITGAPLLRAQAAARVNQWIDESNKALSESLSSLAPFSKNGSLVFVPTSPPFSSRTAAFAPSSMTFGFSCLPRLQGVDEVRAAREEACDHHFPNPSPDNAACKITSAFHPDAAGHGIIAKEIEDALVRQGRFAVAPGQ